MAPKAAQPKRSALYTRRPKWVSQAGSKFYAQQGTAGKDKAYGAVGSPDYVIELRRNGWEYCVPKLSVWDVVASFDDPSSLRILDLGTGDGTLLYALHKRFNIPWANLVGVSAEDMRGLGLPLVEGLDMLDLHEFPEAKDSYVVWNIEDLHNCKAMQGQTFDLVVSFVCICWLTDPFGALELIHDKFLKMGGHIMFTSVQMQVVGVGAIDDQVYLTALRDLLREEGHVVDVHQDESTFYAVWMQKKVREALNLWPVLDYGTLSEGAPKVNYKTQLSPATELEDFDVAQLTSIKVERKFSLTSEAAQLAEALFRFVDKDGSGGIDPQELAAVEQQLLEMLTADIQISDDHPLTFADWMSRMAAIIQISGWQTFKSVCQFNLKKLAKEKVQKAGNEEFRDAWKTLFCGRPSEKQSGPLWDLGISGFAKVDSHPEVNAVLPVFKAAAILVHHPFDMQAAQKDMKKQVAGLCLALKRNPPQREILQNLCGAEICNEESATLFNISCPPQGGVSLEELCAGESTAADLQKDLHAVEQLLSGEKTKASFEDGIFKEMLKKIGCRKGGQPPTWTRYQLDKTKKKLQEGSILDVLIGAECLRVLVLAIVNNIRAALSCTVVTVAVDAEMVTCTSMAGEQIVPPMPVATSTLGDVELAVSTVVPNQRVKIISVEGQILHGGGTLLVAEALQGS